MFKLNRTDQAPLPEAERLLNEAKACNAKGDLAGSIAAYQAAAQIFAENGDTRGLVRVSSGMGKAYGRGKEYAKAAEAFSEAAQFAVQADWPDKEIEVCYNLGLTLQEIGLKKADLAKVGEAIDAFEQGLAVAIRIEDRASIGVLLLSLGFACAWAKQEQNAIVYFEEAVPFALDKIDFDTAFSALSTLGTLLTNENRGSEAIPYYERALELAKSAQGDIVAVADTFANLGIAYEKAGRLTEALEALETWHEILKQVGDVKAVNASSMIKRLKNKMRR